MRHHGLVFYACMAVSPRGALGVVSSLTKLGGVWNWAKPYYLMGGTWNAC